MRPNNVPPGGNLPLNFAESDFTRQFEEALSVQLGRDIAPGDHRAQQDRTQHLTDLCGRLSADDARSLMTRLTSPPGAATYDGIAAQFQSRLSLGTQHDLLKVLQGRFQGVEGSEPAPAAGGRVMDKSIASAAARQHFRSQSMPGGGQFLPPYWGTPNPSAAQKFVFDFLHPQGLGGIPAGKGLGLPAPIFGGGFVPRSPLHAWLDAALGADGKLRGGMALPGPTVEISGQSFVGARTSRSAGADFDLSGFGMGAAGEAHSPAELESLTRGWFGPGGAVTGMALMGFRPSGEASLPNAGPLRLGFGPGAALGLGGGIKLGVDITAGKANKHLEPIGGDTLHLISATARTSGKFVTSSARHIGKDAAHAVSTVDYTLTSFARGAGRPVNSVGDAIKKIFQGG